MLLIVALAAFVVDRSRRAARPRHDVRVMLAALIPAMFVIAQPDLGSGMVYMVIAYMLLFVAGTPWRHLAALAALVVLSVTFVLVAAPAAGVHVLKPYQVERLTAFLHPSSNPQKQGYQQQESKIAIGAGQKTGWRGEGGQIPDGFVPESNTDFIFAAVGEQYGFVGAGLVLLLYALLISRALRILVMSQGPVRLADRGRGSGYADVPGLRQRGDDHWDHADHRRHAAAHELWRLVGDHDPVGGGPAAVDLRAGARLSRAEGPRAAPLGRRTDANVSRADPNEPRPQPSAPHARAPAPGRPLGTSPHRKIGSN